MNKKTNLFYIYFTSGLMLAFFSNCSKKDDVLTVHPTIVTSSKVKDIDGNTYDSVKIGTQIWMVQNLRTTRFRNGDTIPNVIDAASWSNLTTGAYCDYNNASNNPTRYGRLYNWYAVVDSRNLAPVGWHVSTDADWAILQNYLIANGFNYDGSTISNYVAKSLSATTEWYSSSVLGAIGYDLSKNNKSGFSALPTGYRIYNGSFANITFHSFWWTSTEANTTKANYRSLHFSESDLTSYTNTKNWGHSVRCVKD